MVLPEESRYRRVSRRAMLKATLGGGVVILGACSNADAQIFAGAVAEPVEPSTTSTTSTTLSSASTTTSTNPQAADPTETDAKTTTTIDADAVEEAPIVSEVANPAVVGSMVVSFTYTRVGERLD